MTPTLKEIKDQVAKKYGYGSYDSATTYGLFPKLAEEIYSLAFEAGAKAQREEDRKHFGVLNAQMPVIVTLNE